MEPPQAPSALVDWDAEKRQLCEELKALAERFDKLPVLEQHRGNIYRIAYDQGCQSSKVPDPHTPITSDPPRQASQPPAPDLIDWAAEEKRLNRDLEERIGEDDLKMSGDPPGQDSQPPAPDLIDWAAEEERLNRDLEERIGEDVNEFNIYRHALALRFAGQNAMRQLGLPDKSTCDPHP